jgi:hypothetical protein
MPAAISTCSSSPAQPNMNSSRLAAPVFTEATSDAGTPSTWKITRAGSSQVSAETMSARPSCSRSAMKRRTVSRTKPSIWATRRGVKAR